MADPVVAAPRMNSLIHRAVLRDLDRFGQALPGFTAGDRDRASALADAFDRLDRLLTHHHEGEEEHLWPLLGRQPQDAVEVGRLTDEHDRIISPLEGARAAFSRLRTSASAADAEEAATAVRETREAAAAHFEHEERDLPKLLSAADQQALPGAVRKLGRGQPLGQALIFLQWVVDGADADQRAFLRSTIPPPAHWLSQRLAGRRYARTSAAAWG